MKKLLVLLMVIGLVSNAQAALSLSLSMTSVWVGDEMTLSVSSDNADMWSGYLVLSEDIYAWADPIAAQYDPPMVVYSAAGDLGYAAPVSGYPAVYYLQAAGSSLLPQPGIQFSIGIQGVQAGMFYIALQNPTTYENLVPPLFIWPEPATICLFGFGVLFLRRRK
jgi:hypothetical protein